MNKPSKSHLNRTKNYEIILFLEIIFVFILILSLNFYSKLTIHQTSGYYYATLIDYNTSNNSTSIDFKVKNELGKDDYFTISIYTSQFNRYTNFTEPRLILHEQLFIFNKKEKLIRYHFNISISDDLLEKIIIKIIHETKEITLSCY